MAAAWPFQRGAIKGTAEVGGDMGAATKAAIQGILRGTKEVGVGTSEALSASAVVKATAEVGGDLATAARNAVEGAIAGAEGMGLSAEEAATAGALKGAGEISTTAMNQVRDVVTGTTSGVKVVVKEPFK
ncbi:hypothetical protein [Candidatus Nitrospira bockiana]